MTNKSSLAVAEVIRQSRLAVVKLTNEIVEVDEKGEQVYSVYSTSISKRGKHCATTFTDFPYTEQGLEEAQALKEELDNWSVN